LPIKLRAYYLPILIIFSSNIFKVTLSYYNRKLNESQKNVSVNRVVYMTRSKKIWSQWGALWSPLGSSVGWSQRGSLWSQQGTFWSPLGSFSWSPLGSKFDFWIWSFLSHGDHFDPHGDHFDPNGDHFDPIGNHFDPNGDHFDPDENFLQCTTLHNQ